MNLQRRTGGGETNDHFSGNVTVGGARRTAAFLLKGPSDFREMTLDMCGKRADQIFRLAGSHADISIVQNAHLIEAVIKGSFDHKKGARKGMATKWRLTFLAANEPPLENSFDGFSHDT